MRRALLTAVVVLLAAAVPAVGALLAGPRATAVTYDVEVNTTPAFGVENLVPGDSITRCFRVRNLSGAPAKVLAEPAVTGDLAAHLRAVAEVGTGLGDAGPSCAGFAADGYAFGTSAAGVPVSSLADEQLPSWPADAARSYRITLSLPSSAGNDAQDRTALARFRWSVGAVDPAPEPPLQPQTPAPRPPTAGGAVAGDPYAGLTDAQVRQIARRWRVKRIRVLADGTVVVRLEVPLWGAVRVRVLPMGARTKRGKPLTAGHVLNSRVYPGEVVLRVRPNPAGRSLLRSRKRAGRGVQAQVQLTYRAIGRVYVRRTPRATLLRARRR